MVVGIDDFRGHDPAHEEDGPWRRTIKSEVKTQMCLHVRGTLEVHGDRRTHLSSGV